MKIRTTLIVLLILEIGLDLFLAHRNASVTNEAVKEIHVHSQTMKRIELQLNRIESNQAPK